MQQFGEASVVGVDGTLTYPAPLTLAAMPTQMDGEQRCVWDDFPDGFGELIGGCKKDEREWYTITLVPKGGVGAGALTAALKALKYPDVPSKITLSNVPDTGANDIGHNGDYMYVGGASRTMISGGRAAIRLAMFRPKTSSKTVTQLTTLATLV